MVETVISYVYEKVIYWGTCEGVARGLPTEVFENGKPPFQIGWGMRSVASQTEVCFQTIFFLIECMETYVYGIQNA